MIGWMFGQTEATESDRDLTPNELVIELEKACLDTKDKKESLKLYKGIWGKQSLARETSRALKREKEKLEEEFESYDESALKHGVLRWLRFAFAHRDTDWREFGVVISRTFFHLAEARKGLARDGLVGQLLILSLPEVSEHDSEEDEKRAAPDDAEQNGQAAQQQLRLQVFVAEVLSEMVDYEEFAIHMCSIAVLNFLCLALNQVSEAVHHVARVFSKLSQDPRNLVMLVEGSVATVLESFFKICNHRRPSPDDRGAIRWRGEFSTEEDQLGQYSRDISALSDCAQTLGTLIKFGHACRADLPTIVRIFWDAVGLPKDRNPDGVTDDVRLLAELSRLLYWELRRTPGHELQVLRLAAEETSGDHVLEVLCRVWARCVQIHEMVTANDGDFEAGVLASAESNEAPLSLLQYRQHFFDRDDMQRYRKNNPLEPRELARKIHYSRMSLCYTNCMLWILLPLSDIRWKMRDLGFKALHYAFDLEDEDNLAIILATVRFIMDLPRALDSQDFIDFFGNRLLSILDVELQRPRMRGGTVRLLLDALSILAMQRGMQLRLAQHGIYAKLYRLQVVVRERWEHEELGRGVGNRVGMDVDIAMLRTAAQVAAHPAHRLSWIGPTEPYPERKKFSEDLRARLQDGDEFSKTIAALLLQMFNDEKLEGPVNEYEPTFRSILSWWQANSTATFEEKVDDQLRHERGGFSGSASPATLAERLERAKQRREDGFVLTFKDALTLTAPHPSILALALFSRLALEPRFKPMIFDHALEAILGCVCTGIWAEAREAAAVVANLMWLPDVQGERLVCWLKFDSPSSVALDSANVLLPVKVGHPRPVPMGKGMYKSIWGLEFSEGSCVVLHPDGLCTEKIPGLLTTASPYDTFALVGNEPSNQKPYEWYDPDKPDYLHFTITCWFYWPLHFTREGTSKPPHCSRGQAVLIHSHGQSEKDRVSQVYFDHDNRAELPGGRGETSGTWTLVDNKKVRRPLQTPELSVGWHMLSVISSTSRNGDPKLSAKEKELDGTKFCLDGWSTTLKKVWIDNDFYMVGNDSSHGGRRPFGALADFRVYARTLPEGELQSMRAARDPNLPARESSTPDRITRQLARMNAVAILALRLDVPDSAAECLRALGNLASLQSQRARIYHACGRQVMQMLDSPFCMLQRQAARLLSAIA